MSAESTKYRRSQVGELRPWHPGDDMDRVSVSASDREAGSPKAGDMIARNPANHADQWLVAADYFAANFEPAPSPQGPAPTPDDQAPYVCLGCHALFEKCPDFNAHDCPKCGEKVCPKRLFDKAPPAPPTRCQACGFTLRRGDCANCRLRSTLASAAPTPRRPARTALEVVHGLQPWVSVDDGLKETIGEFCARNKPHAFCCKVAVMAIEADRLAPVQGEALAEVERLRARLKELEAEVSFWQEKHAIASFRASDAEDALDAATQPPTPPTRKERK